MCQSRIFNLKEKHRHLNSLVFTIAKGKVMQILQKIMKSKDLIHFLYIFFAQEQLNTPKFLSSNTLRSTCTLLKYLL